MSQKAVEQRYREASEQYAAIGVDTDTALATLERIPIAVQCWQGDDVAGFESRGQGGGSGGIQVTGNYPGRARNVDELREDLQQTYRAVPGSHRLALHMMYGEFGAKQVDRDAIRPEHFAGWAEWSRNQSVPLDMNGTFFAHPKAEDGFTLSSKDQSIRRFWVEHARRTREVSAYLGRQQGSPCINNLWIPDGMKDYPADRYGLREQLRKSLDEIHAEPHDKRETRNSLEPKLFGIGSEAFVVGSLEFYLAYGVKNGLMVTIDTGHYHPTELVADKISSVYSIAGELVVHVSRPMRWDSDHVVLLNDDVIFLMEEIARIDDWEHIHVGLDFFDATINRVGAWVVGARSTLKGLLFGLLQPRSALVNDEEHGNYLARMIRREHLKTMPLGGVWNYHCMAQGTPTDPELLAIVQQYDERVTRRRA